MHVLIGAGARETAFFTPRDGHFKRRHAGITSWPAPVSAWALSSDKASSPMLETSKGLQNHTPSTSRLLLYSRSLRILLTLRKHASAFFTYPKKHRHPSNSTKPIPFFCPWKMHWHKLQHVSCSTRVPSARNASARAAKALNPKWGNLYKVVPQFVSVQLVYKYYFTRVD